MTENTSIRRAARITGYSAGHISRVLCGKKGVSRLSAMKIARAMGMTVDRLFRTIEQRVAQRELDEQDRKDGIIE